MMDHAEIEEQALVDRYLQGRLTAPERIDFEDHFVDCPQCLEQLELAQAFRGGLRDAVTGEVVRQTVTAGLLARLFGARRGLAVALLFVLALPVAWLLGRGQQEAGGEALQPQANVPTYSLNALRGAEPIDPEPILTVPADEWLALEIPTEGEAFPTYRLALFPLSPAKGEAEEAGRVAEQRAVWQQEGLQPDREGRVRVTFPPGSLPEGLAKLRLSGLPQEGDAVPLASYRLQALR